MRATRPTRGSCRTPTSAGYLDANDLVVVANEMVKERRDMERYLDVAGLEGEARERVARMAPAVYEVEMGWYVARKL